MTSRDLASIASVVMGLFALIAAAPLVQTVLAAAFWAEELPIHPTTYFAAVSVPVVLLVTGGVWLILRRRTLAEGMSSEESDPPEPISAHWVESLVFAVVGLYLAVSALPSLAELASEILHLRVIDSNPDVVVTIHDDIGYWIGTVLMAAFGVCLFVFSDRVPRLRRSLARRSLEPAPHPEDDRPACSRCGTRYSPEDYRPEVAERRCSRCGELLDDDGST